jgi:guanyl-specific ribonuclease Sa
VRLRHRITWGHENPFDDPRLKDLDKFVREIRVHRRLPLGVSGGSEFKNRNLVLPPRAPGYYKEYDVEPGRGARGILRLVLGEGGDVYISGIHYKTFRQVIEMPT